MKFYHFSCLKDRVHPNKSMSNFLKRIRSWISSQLLRCGNNTTKWIIPVLQLVMETGLCCEGFTSDWNQACFDAPLVFVFSGSVYCSLQNWRAKASVKRVKSARHAQRGKAQTHVSRAPCPLRASFARKKGRKSACPEAMFIMKRKLLKTDLYEDVFFSHWKRGRKLRGSYQRRKKWAKRRKKSLKLS